MILINGNTYLQRFFEDRCAIMERYLTAVAGVSLTGL